MNTKTECCLAILAITLLTCFVAWAVTLMVITEMSY
jgi:hypothetical protein